MAETVRRRYTRLLREARERHPPRDEEGGEASPQELQRAVDDLSAAAHGKPARPMTDAAAVHTRATPAGARTRDGRTGEPGDAPSSILHPPFSRANLPDLILIDGGKGQLNAACAELARLGLNDVPVIGLAKEFEEIYRPGQSDPLRLSHDTGALKLLQRVRDESHRFANTYHAQLRLKRISESILDEFPGIGEQRKAALLKKFGSVHRLRLATIEQIAEVPGFGGKAAADLKTFLAARSAVRPVAAEGA
jgi:excinuclease ABC subunit C